MRRRDRPIPFGPAEAGRTVNRPGRQRWAESVPGKELHSITSSRSHNAHAILIVEDDPATGEILQRMIALKFRDLEVLIAATGEKGLELFREHRPDIVITDINLPTMDGLRMISEMKTTKPELCAIVLTGYDMASQADRIKEVGICGYILKPIEFHALFAAIGTCLSAAGSDAEPGVSGSLP
ncbi:response regulator [Geobacter sp. SVR]|uniref:response regulator n=1 Tax=Geobacter sp. SVR TaxID=2495594 RepID=UPI001566DD34|nr:response regulator [Geobacter sp. SVR]